MVQQHLVGQDLLIEASQSHPATSHSVGLLWTSDHPDPTDLYLATHNTHKRQTIHKPNKQATADPRLNAANGIDVDSHSCTECRIDS
jgi:hypothetical protein